MHPTKIYLKVYFGDEDRVLLEEEKSEIPCRVSSDAHEWRNDWITVSGNSSVKIQWG